MNCRGLWQLAVCCRHNYHLLTRKGADLKFLPESLRLQFEISKRSFTREADSGGNNHIKPGTIQQAFQALVDLKMKIEYGHTCIITQCPKVGSRSDSLYINTTSGHFVCEHCNKQGPWPDLLDNLELLKTQRDRLGFTCFKDLESVRPFLQDIPSSGRDLLSSCVPFGSLQDEDADRLKATFGLEMLKTETLDRFGVRCDLHNNYVVFPVIVNGCVRSLKKIMCHSHSDEETGTLRETHIPRSGVSGVFGLDMVAPSVTDVVLTSSEVDAMAVVQETNVAAIALTHGYSSLPQEVLPSLERFKTIILWFDDSFKAWESAELFSKKLNSKRCHVIRPSMDYPGPLTALTQGLKLSTILGKAEPISPDSLMIDITEKVFLSVRQDAGVKCMQWKRYPILNKLLKRHRRGELTVLSGPKGSGKTTFLSEYSLDLCMQGVNTLWGSFQNNKELIGEIMLTQFAQQKLTKNTELSGVYADLFQSLPMYFMPFHGLESIEEVVNAMSHAVYVHDIAHVVLDNLQFALDESTAYYDILVNEEEELGWNDHLINEDSLVSACMRFARSMNCHVTLVIPPFKEVEGDLFSSARTTETADNVHILHDDVQGRKFLEEMEGDLFSSARTTETADNVHILQDDVQGRKYLEEMEGDLFSSARTTETADNVFILHDDVQGRKYLEITKSWLPTDPGRMLLKFDQESLSFAAKEK